MVEKGFTIWTIMMVVFLLVVEGYRPELLAQIR